MSETSGHGHSAASEIESRETAEEAREQEWRQPSFLKEIFLGNLRLDLVPDFAVPGPERPEFQAFYERMKRFLAEEVDADAIDREGKVPERVVKALAEMGAFGMKIPVEYGGLGFSQREYGRILQLVGSWDGNIIALLSAHQSIGVPQPLQLFGTEEQKRKYLPRLAKGAISAFALTERHAGSDPAHLATSATRTPEGDFLLNGEKLWITNGTVADFFVVMARHTDTKKITAFIVEKEMPGVTVVRRCHFMGLRAIENGVLRFTNVRVPKENVLLEEGRGLKLALVTLNTGRLTLPAACAAIGKRCVEITRRWAGERVQWGQPIGRHDAIAQILGDMAATAFALDAIAGMTAAMADGHDRDIRLEAAVAKMWNTEEGWRMVDQTLQVRGGRGFETADSLKARGEPGIPVERMLRDYRINLIFEGSSEIMRLFIAREAVDTHLRVAGPLIDPKAPAGRKLAALVKAGLFYARWYPSQFFGWALWPRYAEFGPLAPHLRFVNRASRRLARTLFHAMIRFGPRLEKKQAVLFRLVEIGAELFAMSAACSKAQRLVTKAPANRGPVELADLFCRHSAWRVTVKFEEVFSNEDDRTYRVAQRVLAKEHVWLEEGIAGWEGNRR
ncbi:MAG: acyl-CoA dehydrogenase family protein [Acidithiobacillales bacterium]